MNKIDEGRQYYERCAAIRDQVLAERPDMWPAVHDRALSFNNEAFLYFPNGTDAAAARALHRKALKLIEDRAKVDPANFETKKVLAETLYYEATTALHSGDAKGAAEGYRRCLEIRKELAREPKAKMSQIDLMLALARCGEHAEAARIAEMLIKGPAKDGQLYFFAACGYALAAGAVASDAAMTCRYSDKALDCLREGKKGGWSDVASLETDPDLAPIRKETAFQALIAEFKQPADKRP